MMKTVLHQNNQTIGGLLRMHRILQGCNLVQAGALLGVSLQQFR